MASRQRQRTSENRADTPRVFEYFIEVLGYREDAEWVALTLDMDLRGYGDTFEEATADLSELIRMQISFAHSKGSSEMIWKPAEPLYYKLFADAYRDTWARSISRGGRLEGEPGDETEITSTDLEYRVSSLELPPLQVIDGMDRFQLQPLNG